MSEEFEKIEKSVRKYTEDGVTENVVSQYEIVPGGTVPEDKPVFVVSPEAQKAADAATAEIRGKSFSGRHPELGKMIKCLVCVLRHRDSQKCEQRFKELWIDEDIETGERTTVYATVPLHNQKPTIKAIVGAKQFAGKRKFRRPNPNMLQVVELTRELFPTLAGAYDKEEDQMLAARAIAIQLFKKGYRRKADRKTRQQKVSRGINRGLYVKGLRGTDRSLKHAR